MKKYVIAGPEQCGSTRLFNLIRLLHEELNFRIYSGGNIKIKQVNKKVYDVCINKEHTPNNYDLEYEYDIIFLPYRDVRDSFISTVKRWSKRNDYINEMTKSINIFYSLLSYSKTKKVYLFKYEDYSLEYIKQLCSFLELKIKDKQIIKIMRRLNELHNSKELPLKKANTKNKLYMKSLLTQRHNTSGGKIGKYINYFTLEQKTEILSNIKIHRFLEEYGYLHR